MDRGQLPGIDRIEGPENVQFAVRIGGCIAESGDLNVHTRREFMKRV
jgi:hypothetical protein